MGSAIVESCIPIRNYGSGQQLRNSWLTVSGLTKTPITYLICNEMREDCPNADEVRSQVDRIASSAGFAGSERLTGFLRFVVEKTLAGDGDLIKEYTIGLEVYQKRESYDPRTDSLVRVEASKLRSRLAAYYESAGSSDSLIISIPRGGYVPSFQKRPPEIAPTPLKRRKFSGVVLGGVLLSVIVVLAALSLSSYSRTRTANWPLTTRLTWDAGLTYQPAIDAQGKLVVYASDRGGQENLDIWVQQIPGGQATRLTNNPADDWEPAFSPDGTAVAFRSNRLPQGIYTVPPLGGEARLLVEGGRRPAYSPDGKWVAYWTGLDDFWPGQVQYSSQVFVIPSSGGTPRVLQTGLAWSAWPVWSPDGKQIAIFGGADDWDITDADWWVMPADGGKPKALHLNQIIARHGAVRGLNPPSWREDGLLFPVQVGDAGAIIRLRQPWANTSAEFVLSVPGSHLQVSAAAIGPIVISAYTRTTDIWSLDSGTTPREAPLLRRLTEDAAEDRSPSLTADGRTMVFSSNRLGTFDIWTYRFDDRRVSALVISDKDEGRGLVSPDGSAVAYWLREGGDRVGAVFLVATEGGAAKRICDQCALLNWSMDGRQLIVYAGSPVRYTIVDLRSGGSTGLRLPSGVFRAQFGPDGTHIAFHVHPNRRGMKHGLFFARLHEGQAPPQSEWIQVAPEGLWPSWSPNRNLVYFLSDRDGYRCVWGQRYDPSSYLPLGDPTAVHHLHSARYSLGIGDGSLGIAAGGNRVVVNVGELRGNIWTVR